MFSKVRDPRLVTVRRGGALQDADHHLLALWAAAYAIRAARATAAQAERDEAGRQERRWQRAQLPAAIRDLVLDDQRRRNAECWSVFEC